VRVRLLGRRKFIALLGGVAAWPLAGHAAQPERVRRIGVLITFPQSDALGQASMTALAQALSRFGWAEGKNIRIDYRFAAGDPTLFKTYAAELVGLSPDVLLAGSSLAIVRLRQQTRTIPIIFVNVSDPVGQGFVESLARPGGNSTGFTAYDAPLMGKWLQLLKEIAPSITRVTVIFTRTPHPTPHRSIPRSRLPPHPLG
jgi:putative ABC transport system substrate-binding protein